MYRRAIPSSRTGAIYNAFSYPTKIDSEAIALYIATHTEPGATVLDPFGGSGSTGIAARLCSRPTRRMKDLAKEYGVRPRWGERHAVIYELSPVGALLATVMTDPPNAEEFEHAATSLVEDVERSLGWMYKTVDDLGEQGTIRRVVWTEVLRTPCCESQVSTWDAAVQLDPAEFLRSFDCPSCGDEVALTECERVTQRRKDPATGRMLTSRRREPAMVYGTTGRRRWSREATEDDLRLLRRIDRHPFPEVAPTDEIGWGDLYRSGYHAGIERFHHLYTRRNLSALAALWAAVDTQPAHLRDALRLLVLSYNASHSTLMTRVVAKRGQRDLVVSGAQSGVLYISGLPVEKNVITGVRQKVRTFVEAFDVVSECSGTVKVVNGSSTSLGLSDESVDYVFTDPPFGDFIPYAEVNQVNEAWLGSFTDQDHEAIISRAQGKGVDDYRMLMEAVFSEVSRVLRPSGQATVIFHASKAPVWQAVSDAFETASLTVTRASVLDKTQVSFKQVVSSGGTRGDAVLLLRHADELNPTRRSTRSTERAVKALLRSAGTDPDENDLKRLYSRYVGSRLQRGESVDLDAPAFYAIAAQMRDVERE